MIVIILSVLVAAGVSYLALAPFGVFDFDKDIAENAKRKERIIRQVLFDREPQRRYYVRRSGRFFVIFSRTADGRQITKRIPVALTRVFYIDDYDLPCLEIRQELLRYPSGRIDVSCELYRLYIQKDRIFSGLLL